MHSLHLPFFFLTTTTLDSHLGYWHGSIVSIYSNLSTSSLITLFLSKANLLFFCLTRGYDGSMFRQSFASSRSTHGISLYDQVKTSLFFLKHFDSFSLSSFNNRVPTSIFFSRSFGSKLISISSSIVLFGMSVSSSTFFKYAGKKPFDCYLSLPSSGNFFSTSFALSNFSI